MTLLEDLDTEQTTTVIRIGLPLPIDVWAPLGFAIDALWPGSVIDTALGGPTTMAIKITRDRALDPDVERAVPEPAGVGSPASSEVTIDAMSPDGPTVGLPEDFVLPLAEMARTLLAANPAAVNYLEMHFKDPGDDQLYTVTIANPTGKTAHALRVEADEHVERLRAQLADAGLTPVD